MNDELKEKSKILTKKALTIIIMAGAFSFVWYIMAYTSNYSIISTLCWEIVMRSFELAVLIAIFVNTFVIATKK